MLERIKTWLSARSRVKTLEEVIKYKDEEHTKLQEKYAQLNIGYRGTTAMRKVESNDNMRLKGKLLKAMVTERSIREELKLMKSQSVRRMATNAFRTWLNKSYGIVIDQGELTIHTKNGTSFKLVKTKDETPV